MAWERGDIFEDKNRKIL